MDFLGFFLWAVMAWWLISPRRCAEWLANVRHYYVETMKQLDGDQS